MGRMLGAFDPEDELDRPDLNQCPDCGCFFALTHCPLCGKECPEEMRAGNRKPVKQKKRRRRDSGRVTFVEWYHSWWFIILMLFLFPIVGIVLLVTSPHKKSVKLAVVAVGILYTVISFFGLGSMIQTVTEWINPPVNASLSREEYVGRCEEVTAESYYRSASSYEDRFVAVTLEVVDVLDDDRTYYICQSKEKQSVLILVRDCFLGEEQRLLIGDVVTVYGEGAKNHSVYNGDYGVVDTPCINGAYVELKN